MTTLAVPTVWGRVKNEWDRVRPLPYIQQVNQAECGIACLAMVLAYHGRPTRLEVLQATMQFGREGVSAISILEAGKQLGLRGRGVRLELEALGELPRGTILHWAFNHFVVLDRVTKDGRYLIHDPGTAPQAYTLDDLKKNFTGVALILEPSEHFEKASLPNATVAMLKRVLAERELVQRILVIAAIAELVSLALPAVTGVVVDRILPRRDFEFLTLVAVGAVFLAAFYGALLYLREQLVVVLRVKFDVGLVVGLLEHLLALPFSFFQLRDTGRLAYRFQSATWIRDTLSAGATSTLIESVFALAALLALFVFSGSFGLIVLVAGALQVIAFVVLQRRLTRLSERDLELMMKSNHMLIEMINGIETLKVAGAEGRALRDWSNLYVKTANNLARRGEAEARMVAVRQGIGFFAPLAVLLWGCHLTLHGQMSVGLMLASNALGFAFLYPLGQAASFLTGLGALKVHVNTIDDVFAQKVEQVPGGTARVEKLEGQVSVKNLSFQYPGRAGDVLKDICLDVPAGAFVAIVGSSGSGKTTLGRVLLGLLLPSQGEVAFDGVPLSELDLGALRRQVGVVSQATRLFARTVRDNVTLMDESVPVEDVNAALRLACVDGDIEKLPLGIHAEITEDGKSLSGGQRQRLALARALLRRPAIMLLDEATSALDSATEQKVQANLDALACTRIVIAHRLSTVVRADLIVVLDQGRIVETGTHAELLERGGVYAQLVGSQLG